MMNWLSRWARAGRWRLLMAAAALATGAGCVGSAPRGVPRAFAFSRDTFAFSNQLYWVYRTDAATGRTTTETRDPKPDYAHHCFPMARAAREFLFHARFDAGQPAVDAATYRTLVRRVLGRSARTPGRWNERVVIPGQASLREFSIAWEALLKEECGGWWASYFQRGNWRMVFPFTRRHQAATARALQESLQHQRPPILHLTDFPRLRLNHAVVVIGVEDRGGLLEFSLYDPNLPDRPGVLRYDPARRRFSLPPTHYFAGGEVDAYEVYRGWCH